MCCPSNTPVRREGNDETPTLACCRRESPPSSLSHQVTTYIQRCPARISSGWYRLLFRWEICGKWASRVRTPSCVDSILDQPCFPPSTPTPRPRRSTSGDSLQEYIQSYSRRHSTSTSPAHVVERSLLVLLVRLCARVPLASVPSARPLPN